MSPKNSDPKPAENPPSVPSQTPGTVPTLPADETEDADETAEAEQVNP